MVLVLSNCLLGALSVWLLRELDRDYSGLIGETLPLLGKVRAAGRESTDAYRLLVAGFVESDPVQRGEIAARANEAIGRAKQARQDLKDSELAHLNPDLTAELQAAGLEYERVAAEVLQRITAGFALGTERERFERLEAALGRVRNANRVALDFLEGRGQSRSEELSAKVQGRTALVLGVAGWPLVAAAVVGALVAAVLAGMFFILRRAGADDSP